MCKHLVVGSLRKLTIASIALAGLGSAMVISMPAPAEAKRMTCVQKYRACNSRCAARSSDQNWQNCIYRTCDPQYDICAGAGFAAGKPMTPKGAGGSTATTEPQKPADKPGKKPSSGAEHGKKNGGFGHRGPIFVSKRR